MTEPDNQALCPLCASSEAKQKIDGPDRRLYHLCDHCHLIFVDPTHHLDPGNERKRYELHQNSEKDAGYVNFLMQAIKPTLPYTKPGMRGLDFGCGPTPVLGALLAEQGVACDNFDPFFFPTLEEDRQYDFIFATECFEHFFHPRAELDLINRLLRQGGTLTVMTELWHDTVAFSSWAYARDASHVLFFHPLTIDYISKAMHWQLMCSDDRRVVVLMKPLAGSLPLGFPILEKSI